jgi:hypothetical protein
MSLEKLQRLAELDAQRKQLTRQLGTVELEIEKLVNSGIEIAGMKLAPAKGQKRAPREYVKREPVIDKNTGIEIPHEEEPGGPNGDGSLPNTVQILNLLSNKPDRTWTPTEIGHALGISYGNATNAISDLWSNGKINRVERGKYQAIAASPQVRLPEDTVETEQEEL